MWRRCDPFLPDKNAIILNVYPPPFHLKRGEFMFGGLFGGGKKKTSDDKVQPLAGGVAATILQTIGTRSIPPMPGAAQKAFKLSVDPKAEARDFIDVIESDEALSARILKIANSVFFDRGQKSTTIEQAVVVIGLNELRSLLNATSLAEIFPSTNPIRASAWANDIATALIARQLSQRFCPQKSEVAFLGGLMHDLGRLLLIQRAADAYCKVIKTIESTGKPFHEVEGEVFPFDHTEVGQLIGEKWNFTPELLEIIRNHHQPFTTFSGPTLPVLIKCADLFAHALGLGHPKGLFKLKNRCEELATEAWDFLGVTESERLGLMQQFQKTYELEFDLYSGKGT